MLRLGLKVSHHPTKFGGDRHCGSENKIVTTWSKSHVTLHGRSVNFERGCRINGQRGTNVEYSLQKIFFHMYR